MAQKIADAVVCVFPHSVSGALTPQEAFAPENIRALYSLTKEQYEAVFGPEKPAGPKFEHYVRSGQKLLRCGYTTGTCAALGAAGAARLLLTGHAPESVALRTPKGIVVEVAPLYCRPAGAGAECAIEKDGGDDVDVTTGLPVIAAVELLPDTTEIRISGGKGVGRVTKAGLDQPVGEAAINHVPRQMIAEALQREAESACYTGGFAVTISIEGGEEVAKRTFNPHIGVEGGLSVLGTSGIVEPMSQQAILDTIQLEMNQAALLSVSPTPFINTFAGSARAKAADRPGVTKGKQWVSTEKFDLLDMPGVLWKKFDSKTIASNLAFIGSIKDDILDVEELAMNLLDEVRRNYPDLVAQRYKLDAETLALPPYELLEAIGRKRGLLVRGGEVNTERCAIMLVDEFRACKWGRISLERPPQRDDLADFAEEDDE